MIRLLDLGADPNRTNKEGDTPWDYAVFYNHLAVKAILEQHGAVQQSRKSAVQQREDSVYDAFDSKDAIERFIKIIDESKADKPNTL